MPYKIEIKESPYLARALMIGAFGLTEFGDIEKYAADNDVKSVVNLLIGSPFKTSLDIESHYTIRNEAEEVALFLTRCGDFGEGCLFGMDPAFSRKIWSFNVVNV